MTDPAVEWVPLYFGKWIIGTMELTGDAELAFWRLCLKGYEKQSATILASEQRLAHWCKLPTDRFLAALDELADLQKVERVEGGLYVPSIDKHLTGAVDKLRSHQRGAAIARRKKELRGAGKTPEQIETQIAEEFAASAPLPPAPPSPPLPVRATRSRVAATASAEECDQAAALWNALAEKHGLSQIVKLTMPRRASLTLRLKEAGGIEGFRHALAQIEKSTFLLGSGKTSWQANFDWLMQASSFTKLLEGGYTDPAKKTQPSAARSAFRDLIKPEGEQ